jgi:hypothetical protein
MDLDLEHLAIRQGGYDVADFAKHWGWRVGSEFVLLLPTALGNVFLERVDGTIWLLDTWAGDLHPVCDSYDSFRYAVGTDAEFVETWFLSSVIASLLAAGLTRGPDQCFTPFVSPALGGSLEPTNFSAVTLNVHWVTSSAECVALKGGPHAAG